MSESIPQTTQTAELLQTLFEATATTTGDEFFRALVRQLATTLEVRQSMISEIDHDGRHARTLAIWSNGVFAENIDYTVTGTPCEIVIQGEIVQIPNNLQSLYPGEQLDGVFSESYLGIPLVGQFGDVIGHVVMLHDKPMVEKTRDFSTLKTFASRATAELERHRTQQIFDQAQINLSQAEKMAAVGKLTAGIAHELNTPVGVIRSNADMVMRIVAQLEDIIKRHANLASYPIQELQQASRLLQTCVKANTTASYRITEILHQLQHFTQLDKASYQLTDLHDSLDSTIALLEPMRRDEVEIVKHYGSLKLILASLLELNQVFLTLLKNANEAIDGAGMITVTTWETDDQVYIQIADTGCGISETQQRELFDVGFADKGTRVGMRTGLSNAYHIIKYHGGDIEVEGAVGQGTIFTINLPIHQADHKAKIEVIADAVS